MSFPNTLPSTYPKKKSKTKKLIHFTFHFHKDGGRRSIAGMAQHSISISIKWKPILKEIACNLIVLNFRNKKKLPWNLVSKIPSRTFKLETFLEKNNFNKRILKILGVNPQFGQNLILIRKLFYTFYTNGSVNQHLL